MVRHVIETCLEKTSSYNASDWTTFTQYYYDALRTRFDIAMRMNQLNNINGAKFQEIYDIIRDSNYSYSKAMSGNKVYDLRGLRYSI